MEIFKFCKLIIFWLLKLELIQIKLLCFQQTSKIYALNPEGEMPVEDYRRRRHPREAYAYNLNY